MSVGICAADDDSGKDIALSKLSTLTDQLIH